MSNRSPKDILADLDKELARVKWCGPPSNLSHLHDPGHLSFFKQLGNFEEVISQWIAERIKGLAQKQGQEEYIRFVALVVKTPLWIQSYFRNCRRPFLTKCLSTLVSLLTSKHARNVRTRKPRVQCPGGTVGARLRRTYK